MVKGLVERNNLIGIANAIRMKNGSNEVYYPSEMASAILAIPTGNEFFTLIPSTQYVTSGESFSLHTILVGDDGVGISGETIRLTGSDGSSYSNLTDNQGVCRFNFDSILSDTTYLASYEDLPLSFVDYAVQGNHNHNYFNQNPTNVTLSEDDTCKTVTSTGGTGGNVYIGSTTGLTGMDFGDVWEVSYDKLSIEGFQVMFGAYNGSSTYQISASTLGIKTGTPQSLRFVCDGSTIKAYVDGVFKTQIDYVSTGHSYLRYTVGYDSGNGTTFKYKNLRINNPLRTCIEYCFWYDNTGTPSHYNVTGATLSSENNYLVVTATESTIQLRTTATYYPDFIVEYDIRTNANGCTHYARIGVNPNNYEQKGSVTLTLPNKDTWYHVKAVLHDGTFKVYLNGEQVGSDVTVEDTNYYYKFPTYKALPYTLNIKNMRIKPYVE